MPRVDFASFDDLYMTKPFIRDEPIIARRPVTDAEFQRLARDAKAHGPGSRAASEFEEACEQMERQRRQEIAEQLDLYDRTSDEAVKLTQVERRIRSTIAQTIEACSKPKPDASVHDLEYRLGSCGMLIMLLHRIEDQRHDFQLNKPDCSLDQLHELYRARQRSHAVRYEHRDRLDMILKYGCERFISEVSHARRLEQDLRKDITDYEPNEDLRFDHRLFDELISASFAGALALESHYDDRIFEAAPEEFAK